MTIRLPWTTSLQHVARRENPRHRIIEVDLLDLDAPNGYTFKEDEYPSTACCNTPPDCTRPLVMSSLSGWLNDVCIAFADTDGISTRNSALFWLPFYHDMGLVVVFNSGWMPAVLTSRCRSCSAGGGCT